MSVAAVRVVEFEHIYRMTRCTTNLTGYGHVVQHLQLVVSLSVGGVVHVRSRCPGSGVWHLTTGRTLQYYNYKVKPVFTFIPL